MSILTSEQLYLAVTRKQALDTTFGPIDHDKLFMPEHLTQLYHTPAYTLLSDTQKLRYNQLFAMRSIEQLMTLEAKFIALVLKRTKKSREVNRDKQLVYCMQEMAGEEQQHYRMFHRINRQAEPSIYQDKELYFARFSPLENLALSCLLYLPGINLFLLWMLLILEEFSTYISTAMVKAARLAAESHESNFVKVHREHLKDESRHVNICANLISTLMSKTAQPLIHLNTVLLRKFMHDYMTPKRGGIRVIEHLCNEFPELQATEKTLLDSIRAQKQDSVISKAIQDPACMPCSHALFLQYPEFRFYDPSYV
jgi:predicted metal-dependent hydrolase